MNKHQNNETTTEVPADDTEGNLKSWSDATIKSGVEELADDDTEGNGWRLPAPSVDVADDTEGNGARHPAPSVDVADDTEGNGSSHRF